MKSNWLVWGILGLVVYAVAKSSAAAAPQTPFVGPINQPGFIPTVPFTGPINQPGFVPTVPFTGPINDPAYAGGGAATNLTDLQTQLWDPCNSGSLVYDPSACNQSGRTTY